jgi:sRNA-binding carbon storage regulator CsrA
MGYLVLTRHEGEQIKLSIDAGVNTESLLKHLLRDGITIHIGELHSGKVKIGVDAPREILVLRDELVCDDESRARTSANAQQ